ncbi:MAG TPA: TatD family hydrolase [Dietzia timorensis]|uniref:TatD family hydrolase n=1 Tax=Dietzia timorensis TaxID=499555 RepID=A0A921JXR5_9ACTN|nr:TatD family hydrolase [Dietzia timorensis]HJE90108.1 TatD family hydrolase [Dietzia timorensis]
MGKKKPRPTPIPPEPLGSLFDAHTHLWSCGARTRDEVRAIMDRAVATGVGTVCNVGDGIEETRQAVAATQWDERVVAAVAVHPTKSQQLTEEVRAELTELAGHKRVVAIGECGLDWYWLDKDETTADKDTQIEALHWHIDLAKKLDKPLMIHNREADEDLMRELKSAGEPGTVILHCFSSPIEVAREALDRGYVLSFAGNSTFPANEHLRQACAEAPAEQILIETDAPFMTPVPFRGARNEPQYIGHTARELAKARGMDAEDFASQTTINARRIYGL